MKIVNWFNDIPLASKISIIGLLALVSVTIPTYLFISTTNEKIEVTELEVLGLEPSEKALNLMKGIAKTRGLSVRLLKGEEQVSGQLLSNISDVNSTFQSLPNAISPRISSNVISQFINEIQVNYTTVTNSVQNRTLTAAESFDQFNQINLKVQELLREIVNRSKLSYNPKPESAYLISAELIEFPRVIEGLGQIRGFASGVFAKDEPSIQELIKAQYLVEQSSEYAKLYLNQIEDAARADNTLNDMVRTAKSNNDAVKVLQLFVQNGIQNISKEKLTSQKVFSEFSHVINNLYLAHEYNVGVLHQLINEQHDRMEMAEAWALTIIFALLAIATLVSFYIVKSINEAVVELGESAERIAKGDFSQPIGVVRKDELGSLAQSLQNMSEQLSKASLVAKEAVRIKQALDSTTSNVMIADDNRIINYINPSANQLFTDAEKDIQHSLPNFKANELIGSNFDIFHANPRHQRDVIKELRQTHNAQITVGKRHFNLVASPIFDNDGGRQGTVVEWVDRTFEVLAERDLSMLIDAAMQGDFSKRANVSGKDGFLKVIAEGLNQIFQQTEQGLSDVNQVLMALAQGDLTKSITNEYQGVFNDLKVYCNNTTENLSEMITEVRNAVDLINNASNEIAQGNSDLSSRTEEQASSLEETASSMEELTSTVKLNSDNANRANSLASDASSVAEDGGALIKQVVENMSSINDSARKISDIIGVIDGIAFQTNILALNAAVEAARAGEQGRGFAVVASEVRTLAQRSATAAKDIKALISDSVSRIEGGNELVNKSGETMGEIVVSIKRVNDLMAEIAAASAEQSTGIGEVGRAISQMDDVTQQNAALVEQAAASAESLRAQSIQLSGQVSKFNIGENSKINAIPTTQNENNPMRSTRKSGQQPLSRKKVKAPDPIEDDWESF